MINKISKRVELFGLALKDEYVFLNRENEVVKTLHDGDIVFVNSSKSIIWKIIKGYCKDGVSPKYSLIKLINGKQDSYKTLPNRHTVLWAIDDSMMMINPFIYYPEGKTKLEKFLIKFGIYDYPKVINHHNCDNYSEPFKITWVETEEEKYPVKIDIYTKNKKINDYIIKELLK